MMTMIRRLVFAVLLLSVLFPMGVASAQSPTPEPTAVVVPTMQPFPWPRPTPGVDYRRDVPTLWSDAMPIVLFVWILVILFGLYRLIVKFLPAP